MVVRPTCEPGRPGLQREDPHRVAPGFDDIRPPGLFGQAGQSHAQRIAYELELARYELQQGDGAQLDGAGVRSEVVQGNEPDGLAGGNQLAGVSVAPAGSLSGGGPAGSIHITSQRCPSGSWKLWLYIKP